GKFLDRPGVLRRALEQAALVFPRAAWYLLPSHLDLSSAERELVEKISGERLISIASEPPEGWRVVARTAHLFRAVGEENEIREVLRRLRVKKVSFDDAELLYTDPKTYPALIFEIAEQHGIPCTFAGGIAVNFSRPGQAAVGLLSWIGGNFEEAELQGIVTSGAIDIPGTESGEGETLASVEAARVLRAAAIGWGRERHLACVDRLITG